MKKSVGLSVPLAYRAGEAGGARSVFARHLLAVTLTAGAMLLAPGYANAAASDPDAVYFDINRFDVRGNTMLPADKINALLAPYTGKQREFADVAAAQEALQLAYREGGFPLVNIEVPEQELDQGVVILTVTPARIGSVKVEGNQHVDQANIRQSLPGLVEGQAPNLSAISKSLKLANENPAKKTIMSLQSGEQADQVDVRLAVTDESPWSVAVNLDNTGSQQTGRTRAGVILQNANLFGRDHVLNLGYSTTLEKPNQVSVYSVGYHIPLYALGDSLDFFGAYSDVDAGTVTAGLLNLGISGKGSIYGARYNQNLTAGANYESKLVYGLDYKAFKNSVQVLGVDIGNSVTVHPVSVGYQGNWTHASGAVGLALTLLHNIPGGERGNQQDFDIARLDARADYNILRFGGSVTQALPAEWQVRAIINGQYTSDALISGEQFGAGGATSVRGFDEREISNDSGINGNLELYSPQLCRNGDWQCRVLGFYDMARATRNQALPGELKLITISSIGVGARVAFRKNVDLQMDLGHVLRAEATATQRGDNRLHVRLSLTF